MKPCKNKMKAWHFLFYEHISNTKAKSLRDRQGLDRAPRSFAEMYVSDLMVVFSNMFQRLGFFVKERFLRVG